MQPLNGKCSKLNVLVMTTAALCLLFLLLAVSRLKLTSSDSQEGWLLERDDNSEQLDGWKATNFSPKHEHLLVAVVFAGSRDERDVIRSTWKRFSSPKDSVVLFAVGIKDWDYKHLQEVVEEKKKNKDMMLLKDVSAEAGRTHKLFHVLQWLEKNVNYSYVLLSNANCFVHLNRLTKDLKRRERGWGLYWGYFVGNAVPQKSGPWAEHRWFLCDRYLPYAISGGYILSSDIVHRIMVNSDLIQLYNNDDVSVGVWTSPFDIERRHDTRFDVEAVSRGCTNNFIITCEKSAEDIKLKYKRLQENLPLCEKEELVRGYVYNWTAKASECC